MGKHANRIREFRKAYGLTLEDVAKIAKTSAQQIQRLENGERRLTSDWMERISEAFGCEPSDLIEDNKNKLSPRQKIILNIFDQLSEEDQERFIKWGGTMVESSTSRQKWKVIKKR